MHAAAIPHHLDESEVPPSCHVCHQCVPVGKTDGKMKVWIGLEQGLFDSTSAQEFAPSKPGLKTKDIHRSPAPESCPAS